MATIGVVCFRYLRRNVRLFETQLEATWVFQHTRRLSTKDQPAFGLLFDIDGVIVRGRVVLEAAPVAFQKLVNNGNKFQIPTVFLTNAGNALRSEKAIQLSKWLNTEITEDQVVMAHSPLRMFRNFHQKHVLVSGQGPVEAIAKNLGFTHVTTIDELRQTFRLLDAVDHQRRSSIPSILEASFQKLNGVVLFGEPIRWETALQLIIDVLMTDGHPSFCPEIIPYPHLPILACNMDLQWMAEAEIPRFGHGAFLVCLENLYKKITGYDLIYTALIGKPSEITYHHAEHMVQLQAKKLGITVPIKRLYAIGDNIHTDVFGANLYNQYLSRSKAVSKKQLSMQGARSIANLLGNSPDEDGLEAEQCLSVLVETGVFTPGNGTHVPQHCPRDFLPVEEKLQEPNYIVRDVLHAIEVIFNKEGYHEE